MDFISNKEPQIKEMLTAIGVSNVDELFSSIPSQMRLPRPTDDDGISEFEGMQFMEALAANNTYPAFQNYLGAGAYEHHVPAIVQAICSKSEFLTSYTPYQAEASQGMLQIIFEFQSAICALTGLDISNASLYDGASACAEAALMAFRIKPDSRKIVVSRSMHPHYRQVLKQYLASHSYQIEEIPFRNDGSFDIDTLDCEGAAAVLIQSPNFFGVMEDSHAIFKIAKEKGVLCILCANPLSYGLFASAAEVGADIAVGDCQPLGLPLQYGGPYCGYIACKTNLVRQLPGRIVGETTDTQGRKGFVLTMQAREQHIRREKATSNICTNQALAALATLITILWYGKQGLCKLALTNYQRAAYLRSKLQPGPDCYFNEFKLSFNTSMDTVLHHFRKHGIEPGLCLKKYYPELSNLLLVSVTETKSKKQLDRYIDIAKEIRG